MRSLLLAIFLPLSASAAAMQAGGGPQFAHRITITPFPGGSAEREPDINIDRNQPVTRKGGGFIASLEVSDNATVGLGRFLVAPRKRVLTQDQPISLQGKASRRAAVGLSLRF